MRDGGAVASEMRPDLREVSPKFTCARYIAVCRAKAAAARPRLLARISATQIPSAAETIASMKRQALSQSS